MSTQAPAKQPKITYSAVGGNMDEVHAGFEAAVAKLKQSLGATHQMYIGGEVRQRRRLRRCALCRRSIARSSSVSSRPRLQARSTPP